MINPEEYIFITNEISNAYWDAIQMQDILLNMVNTNTTSNIDLSNYMNERVPVCFYTTYNMVTINYLKDNSLSGLVVALQQKIVNDYGSLDSYYNSFDIKVPKYFAQISGREGFTVNSQYIES